MGSAPTANTSIVSGVIVTERALRDGVIAQVVKNYRQVLLNRIIPE
ncbi:hypothetical protein PBI_COUNT_88 [Microbacterium phage Count]|nr:hypothetical protein PBI_COUNT_88 [Microbacterium phage Count]